MPTLKFLFFFVLTASFVMPQTAHSGRRDTKISIAGQLPKGWSIYASVTHYATVEERKCMQLKSHVGPFSTHWTAIFNARRTLKEETKIKSTKANRHGMYQLDLSLFEEPSGDCGMLTGPIRITVYDPEHVRNYHGDLIPAATFELTLNDEETQNTQVDVQCVKNEKAVRLNAYECSVDGEKALHLSFKKPIEDEGLILNILTDDSAVR